MKMMEIMMIIITIHMKKMKKQTRRMMVILIIILSLHDTLSLKTMLQHMIYQVTGYNLNAPTLIQDTILFPGENSFTKIMILNSWTLLWFLYFLITNLLKDLSNPQMSIIRVLFCIGLYGTAKKKRPGYLVGNLVPTNWPIEKALHAIGYNQIPTK